MHVDWLKRFLIFSLLVLQSCSLIDSQDDLPKGLIIEVSTESLDSFFQPGQSFTANVTIEGEDGTVLLRNSPVTFNDDGDRFLSEAINLASGSYRLSKFDISDNLKSGDLSRFTLAFAHETSLGDHGFEFQRSSEPSLFVDLLPVIFTDGMQSGESDIDFEVETVEMFYVFINRCNPGNRMSFHEVLSYEATVFELDENGNPSQKVTEGTNIQEANKPGLMAVPLPPNYPYGLIIQLKPIGEEVIYMIPVIKDEIDKCRRNETDFVHLNVGCDA